MGLPLATTADVNPLDALSPTIVAQFRTPEAPTPAARARYRGQIRREVLTCQSCELHRCQEPSPVPFSAPSGPVRFVALGEAPGEHDGHRRRPFTEPGAKLLRSLMTEVGIDAVRDVLWTNAVSCVPGRMPTKTETLACRGNLLAQVEAGYVPYVLIVGGRALDSFRSDLTVTDHHGQFFVWNDLYVVMPILHPAAVLRGQRGYKVQIREDLERFREVVYGGEDAWKFLGETCYRCKGIAMRWDRDGVPMCDKHWKLWGKQWKKEREKWGAAANVQLTF